MADVIVPQKRNKTSQLFELGGAIAGAYLSGGSPAGAAGGALMGAQLGNIAGGVADPQKPEVGIQKQSSAAAMMRRQQQLAEDSLQTLKNAEISLSYLPEDLRQTYAPAIIRARMLEEQKRGLV